MRMVRGFVLAMALQLASFGWVTAVRAAEPLWVDLTAQGLTVYAEGVPLRSIVDKLGQVTGVRVRLDEGRDEPITIAFEDVPIEEGLRRLLRGRNFVFVSMPIDGVERARVFRTGDSRAEPISVAAAGPAEQSGQLSQFRGEALSNPDARRRARALERLAARADDRASIDAVIEMLQRETDPGLLERALDIAGEDPSTPLDVIVKLAQTHPAPRVRGRAVVELGKRATADARARQALEVLAADDPAPSVRSMARSLIQLAR